MPEQPRLRFWRLSDNAVWDLSAIDFHREKLPWSGKCSIPTKTGDKFQTRRDSLSHLADIRKEVIHDAPTMARLRGTVCLPLHDRSQRHAPLGTG